MTLVSMRCFRKQLNVENQDLRVEQTRLKTLTTIRLIIEKSNLSKELMTFAVFMIFDQTSQGTLSKTFFFLLSGKNSGLKLKTYSKTTYARYMIIMKLQIWASLRTSNLSP